MSQSTTKKNSNVDRVYVKLRQLAANFEFKPDARINESALSLELGASRTPLREALNRLAAEGFLTFQSGRGFFCRSLSPSLVLDLYEARVAVETEAMRLACKRATDEELLLLKETLDRHEKTGLPSSEPDILLNQDEEFHLAIARLSQNAELVGMLENLNDRVRYVRLVYLKAKVDQAERSDGSKGKTSAHRVILLALMERNTESACMAMRRHIGRRRKDAAEAVRIAYSQLYVPDDQTMERRL